jgi:hypothetical protein
MKKLLQNDKVQEILLLAIGIAIIAAITIFA